MCGSYGGNMEQTVNNLIEESLNVNEKETYIKLMPKWLAELDFINMLIDKKKELEKQIKLATPIIGEYENEIFKISKSTNIETKIIESNTIQEDFNKTFEDMEKVALEINDLALVEKIKSLKNRMEEDKKVTYAKPQTKVKELNSIYNLLKNKTNDKLSVNDLSKVLKTKTTTEFNLEQKKHIEFEKDLEDEIYKSNGKDFVS